VQGTGIAASVIGCALVWLLLRQLRADYSVLFVLGGLAALAAAAVFSTLRLPGAHLKRPRLIVRREYGLYYVLALLFGARKQIFLTFGPWVLIKVFHQPAYLFAQLWIVAALLGVLFQPALGRAIDRFGERAVLIVDSLVIFGICMGYGYGHRLPDPRLGLGLLCACLVLDQLFFGVDMARDTYLAKIARRPEDVAPSLSLGVSINHAVSMSLPALGGWAWARYGHPVVFLGAAGVAVLMLVFSALIRVPARALMSAAVPAVGPVVEPD